MLLFSERIDAIIKMFRIQTKKKFLSRKLFFFPIKNSIGNLIQKSIFIGLCSNSDYRPHCKQSTERINLTKICEILLPQPPEANKKNNEHKQYNIIRSMFSFSLLVSL